MASQDASAIRALLDQLKSSDAWQKVTNLDATTVTATGTHTKSGWVNSNTAANSETGHTGNTHGDTNHDTSTNNNAPANFGTGSSSGMASVASLLSQLQSSSAFNARACPSHPHATLASTSSGHVPLVSEQSQSTGPDATVSRGNYDGGNGTDTHPRAPHTPPEVLRACTFQQSLPRLARLSEDPGFMQSLAAVSRTMIADRGQIR